MRCHIERVFRADDTPDDDDARPMMRATLRATTVWCGQAVTPSLQEPLACAAGHFRIFIKYYRRIYALFRCCI